MTNISQISKKDGCFVEVIFHLEKGPLSVDVLRNMLLEDVEMFDPRDPVSNISCINALFESMLQEGEIVVHGSLSNDDAMIELAP